MRKAIAALLILGIYLSFSSRQARADDKAQIEAFRPFIGTWKALVDSSKQVYDISRWEFALNDKVMRILHSVGDGAYGGETLIIYDQTKESLVFYYFTTLGFYTTGTIRFDAEGRMHSREVVSGDANGVTEVVATQEIKFDGSMRVHTRMLRNGEWEERGTVIYRRAPDATVILP